MKSIYFAHKKNQAADVDDCSICLSVVETSFHVCISYVVWHVIFHCRPDAVGIAFVIYVSHFSKIVN